MLSSAVNTAKAKEHLEASASNLSVKARLIPACDRITIGFKPVSLSRSESRLAFSSSWPWMMNTLLVAGARHACERAEPDAAPAVLSKNPHHASPAETIFENSMMPMPAAALRLLNCG